MPPLRTVPVQDLVRAETNDIKKRVQRLETQEPVTEFTSNLVSPWIDSPLSDTTNGSHFNDDNGTFPAGWSVNDAAQESTTSAPVGFWKLVGAAGNTTYKYRTLTPLDVVVSAPGGWKSYVMGPVIIKDALATADINYYFGIYRNNAGAIDENTFVRININWLQASSLWQIRAERKDGTTQTNGTYYTIPRMPIPPMWLRIALQNSTNRDCGVFMGAINSAYLQTPLMTAAVGSSVTWGQAWMQIHSTRGTGPDDAILIGGVDYNSNA